MPRGTRRPDPRWILRTSVAAIAVGVTTDGRREVLGTEIGGAEAEPIGAEFLRQLTRRGGAGSKLVIPGAHAGIKAAVTELSRAAWQQYRMSTSCRAILREQKGADERDWPAGCLLHLLFLDWRFPFTASRSPMEEALARTPEAAEREVDEWQPPRTLAGQSRFLV